MALLRLGLLGAVIASWAVYRRSYTYSHDIVTPLECSQQSNDALSRFSRCLQFPSVSDVSANFHVREEKVFQDMIDHLSTSYSLVWSTLEVEVVGNGRLSLLLTWRGSDPSLLPVLLISHYDVVPVTPGTEGDWSYPPFSGAVEEGHIWGRGSIDVKFSVICILEAFSQLISVGRQPKRTIMFVVGQDEEVGGTHGAQMTAELFASRGIKFDIAIDEGGVILSEGLAPFTTTPVALIGTSEKVYTMVEVNISSRGGHSSMPPTDGSDVGSQIAKLITFTRDHPFPSVLRQPTTGFFKALAPHCKNPILRLITAHLDSWPLSIIMAPAIAYMSSETAAQVRTTIAVVNVTTGVANNVLPQHGSIRFNLRSHPGDSSHEGMLQYFNHAISHLKLNASATLMTFGDSGPPPMVTNSDGSHFQAVQKAIKEIWEHEGLHIAVAPFLLTGGTDSRHYAHLSEHGVLRFCPLTFSKSKGDLGRVHGTNERVSIHDFYKGLCTYQRIIQLMAIDI
ncbi:hypothetical protein CEUSTIGMA_g667.t1 [Chlamydomonas eustigma]|uniref:Peptidase M20 dimerisation domain-containing protein n=1 Tax=Chlamydomonas eustigma TaxID=1157962 RepID=A0A250WQS7_9CHLO|nr:hypothetical protein CEUSTIGMA_g667.t1 [Chlamydomonas eustigma]|eukprot:GAX73214.1 hypothetical protein CEUSTIGMA_g667.t1 [Chlamydomonas eustigma]